MYTPSRLADTFVFYCPFCHSERGVTEATFSMIMKDHSESEFNYEQDNRGRYKRRCGKCKPENKRKYTRTKEKLQRILEDMKND